MRTPFLPAEGEPPTCGEALAVSVQGVMFDAAHIAFGLKRFEAFAPLVAAPTKS